jgi:hypothetical protein
MAAARANTTPSKAGDHLLRREAREPVFDGSGYNHNCDLIAPGRRGCDGSIRSAVRRSRSTKASLRQWACHGSRAM